MKKQNAIKQARNFDLRPASVEEAGLFYTAENQDAELGTVGHLRMDFGSGGKGFYHTWWPHNGDRLNTPEFKEALQEFVDAMRQNGPLKDLSAMNPTAGATAARSRTMTASTDSSRKRSNTVSVCAAPPGQGIIRGISTATTSASRSWPGRAGW